MTGPAQPPGPWGPPPGQPYPSLAPYPPGFVAPRRRRSRWLTIGLPVGLVLLLGGCGTAIVLLVSAVKTAVGPVQDAAGAYAQALVDQRWEDAHGLLCAQDRDAVTAGALAEHYAEPRLTGFRIDGVHVSNVNGSETGQVSLTFTTADGLGDRTTLPLVKESGSWRPCP